MKELEQAAKEWFANVECTTPEESFIAGYNWQKEQDNWISISTPPEIGERVLVIDDDGDQFIDIRMGTDADEQWAYYTHWQPLPKKPLNKEK